TRGRCADRDATRPSDSDGVSCPWSGGPPAGVHRRRGADCHQLSELCRADERARVHDPRGGVTVHPFVVAIDGPAASGKGTLARRLADRFCFAHLDTGALYRATARLVLDEVGDPADPATAAAGAERR